MSWQLGAFTILAVALAGGFAWYERTKPDARIVALVGTLAAFGALGRIAFAALPNVKPTTDIVLISGYALGGAPGFVVGAVSALTSNFFFGQGPWTPWQMAGWGITGLLGAGLVLALHRRQPNRWFLAAVCGVVGFGFTALQDFGDWVTYSDHSLAQLGVYVGKGLGFDLIHAAGCVAFALAFGPALLRSIARFTARLNVTWLPAGRIVTVLVALAVGGAALAEDQSRAVAGGTPAGYLLSAQNSDGGLGSAPGSASNPLYSGWAALGLAAAGYNLQDVRHGGASLIDYVIATENSGTDPGSIERTMLVLRAAGEPTSGLLGRLEGDIRPNGSVSNQTNLTAFAILALRAAGVSPPANMVGWLMHQQDSDGGFNFSTAGGQSDVDDTGAALEALAGSGDPGIARAVHFIDAQENRDGGFPSQVGGFSNAQSTAWAIQGQIAVGASSGSLGRPLSYLHSLTTADGRIDYSRGDDQTPVWVTAEALMALAGKTLPFAPPPSTGGAAPKPAGSVARRPARHAAATHSPATSTSSSSSSASASTSAAASSAAPRPRHSRRAAPSVSSSWVDQLAVAFGVADALVLAPIG
jgi:energy-coupling factor transport system substrate-specific component